jgi:hypothetical protein
VEKEKRTSMTKSLETPRKMGGNVEEEKEKRLDMAAAQC